MKNQKNVQVVGMTTAYSYIRFSTPEQAQGDSKRRQLSASERVAEENGWTLDTTLRLHDLGVSAFRGDNAKFGALNTFLKAVEIGRVKTGSVLIVESLDRLSRDEILTALNLFTGILQKRIQIYTTTDRRLYTAESVNANPTDLIVSITVMMRAHEESATKSKRVRAAWSEKRANASTVKLSGKCPGWMTLANGDFAFNAHAPTVKRIVQMAVDGHGAPTIARTLNQDKTPVMTQKLATVRLWHYSVIQHVIRSRALIGEYQPCQMVDGKPSPVGEPVTNYYPAILTDDEFYRLQAALATRARGKGKGRTGKNIANLFGRLLHNGIDGGVMTLSQKRKDHLNMVSLAHIQHGTATKSFPYQPFEWHFLQWVREIRLNPMAELMAGAVEGKLVTVRAKINQLTKAMDGDDVTTFTRMVEQLKKFEAQEATLLSELEAEKAKAHAADVDPSDIGKLADTMRTMPAGSDELRELRTRLKLSIASVVERIDVYPYGDLGSVRRVAVVAVKMRDNRIRIFVLQTYRGRKPMSASTGYAHAGDRIGFDPEAVAMAIMADDQRYTHDFVDAVVKAMTLNAAACTD